MTPALETTIRRYADAWNRHDVGAILALHTDDAVFENHTSGGLAVGKDEIRKLIEGVFATFPDLKFATRRLYLGDARKAGHAGGPDLPAIGQGAVVERPGRHAHA
jgi:ketosteroid isomerase-like protein